MYFGEAANINSSDDLALAEDAEITPEYAQKLASNLAGRRLRMFLPREGDGDPDYVWVRLAADVLGIGLSAVVVGASIDGIFGDVLTGYAVRIVPRRVVFSHLSVVAEQYTAQLSLDIDNRDLKHLAGALAVAHRESTFEVAVRAHSPHISFPTFSDSVPRVDDNQTLHRIYVPLDSALKKWKYLNGGAGFMKLLGVEEREMFVGSFLLSLVTSVTELNSDEILALVSRHTDLTRDQLLCVAHLDVKPSNIFLDRDSASGVLRLGDLESVVPCRKEFAEIGRRATFTTARYAPPELRNDGVVTPRCSLWMAASTVCDVACDFCTHAIGDRNPVKPASLAEMMGIPQQSHIITVLCGCLTMRWQDAMSAADAIRLLRTKYSVDFAAQHINRCYSEVFTNRQFYARPATADTTTARGRFSLPPPPNDESHDEVLDADQDGMDVDAELTLPRPLARFQTDTWSTVRRHIANLRLPEYKSMELMVLANLLVTTPYEERCKVVDLNLPISDTDTESNILARGHLFLLMMNMLFPRTPITGALDLSKFAQLKVDLDRNYPSRGTTTANSASLEQEHVSQLLRDFSDRITALDTMTDATTLLFKLANYACQGISKDSARIRGHVTPTLRTIYNLVIALGLVFREING